MKRIILLAAILIVLAAVLVLFACPAADNNENIMIGAHALKDTINAGSLPCYSNK